MYNYQTVEFKDMQNLRLAFLLPGLFGDDVSLPVLSISLAIACGPSMILGPPLPRPTRRFLVRANVSLEDPNSM